MTDSALAQGPGVRALRLAWWCAVVPAGMGLAAVGGWLASGGLIAEVIWFYALGMLAIFLRLALMPVGLGAAWWAWQRGAPGRAVLRGCGLLLANLPSAATVANAAHFDAAGTLDVGRRFAEALLAAESAGR